MSDDAAWGDDGARRPADGVLQLLLGGAGDLRMASTVDAAMAAVGE